MLEDTSICRWFNLLGGAGGAGIRVCAVHQPCQPGTGDEAQEDTGLREVPEAAKDMGQEPISDVNNFKRSPQFLSPVCDKYKMYSVFVMWATTYRGYVSKKKRLKIGKKVLTIHGFFDIIKYVAARKAAMSNLENGTARAKKRRKSQILKSQESLKREHFGE